MQMEEARQIVKAASTFLAAQEPAAQQNRLEQIEEHSSGNGEWSVVLSFADLTSPTVSMVLGNQSTPRVYKELIIDGKTREIVALRFWK